MSARPQTVRPKNTASTAAKARAAGKAARLKELEKSERAKISNLQPISEVPTCQVWQLDVGHYFTQTNVTLATAVNTSTVFLITELDCNVDPMIVRGKRMGIGKEEDFTPTIRVRPYEVKPKAKRQKPFLG